MTRATFTWNLQGRMHAAGIHQIADLHRELHARGIELSSSQTHRLVTQRPERLNLAVLASLCEILRCSPDDLIEVHYARRADTASGDADIVDLATVARPKRARVQREQPEDRPE